jgi:hypothetical protein
MVNARARSPLLGRYAPERGRRGHPRIAACAGRLVSTVLQDVPEACVGVDTSPRLGSAACSDQPAISLFPPAVPVSPLALGHLNTHRTRTESTSRLGAIAARHTGGRDAA